ncbi:hypothetical protein CsatA_029254 [Cannabis sativa]
MQPADVNSFYLGLPSTLGRNKSAALGFLKEMIHKRLQSRDEKFLWKAGKEVLLKAVAQLLPSYTMNVFLLPLEITRDMESMMAKFWWQISNSSQRCIYWLSWNRLCKHKNGGGMGFRDLQDFNLAILGKQGWRLLTRLDSLAAHVFKARYFPNGTFLNASLGNNSSFVWRIILEAQHLIREGVHWCVGNGEDINILDEPWLPIKENPYVSSLHPALFNVRVSNLLSRGCLPTKLQLRTKHVDVSSLCPFCLQYEESTLYILVTCEVVRSCWNRVGIGTNVAMNIDFFDWYVHSLETMDVDHQCTFTMVCWAIWDAKNNLVWNGKLFKEDDVVANAKRFLDQWRSAKSSEYESSWPGFQAGDGAKHWISPQANSIKVNVDAALFDSDHKYGLGLVARDERGLLIERRTMLSNGSIEPELAEAMGVREALSWIKER